MTNFDEAFDRSVTGTRKWSPTLLREKVPGATQPVIAMDLADIDFPCAPAVRDALVERAKQADYSYTFIPDAFYDAVMDWNKQHFGLMLEREWIRLTFGTISALHNIVQALTTEGDSVMIHTPAYAPFAEAVQHNNRHLVCNRLVNRDNRYYIDFLEMERQIRQEHVKILIFCNPQNPSGRVWTREEIEQLAILCHRYGVIVVSDEIHRDIVFRDTAYHSLWAAAPELMPESVMCVSPNKGYNLGGLKTSYIVVPNPVLRDKIYQRLSANYVTSPHVFAVPAIIAAYTKERQWLEDMVDYVEESHRLVEQTIREDMPLLTVMPAESSFLVWIDMSQVCPNEAAIKNFYDAASLSVVLGSYFVNNAEGFVRLNIGMQREKVLEALHRMKQVYDVVVYTIESH